MYIQNNTYKNYLKLFKEYIYIYAFIFLIKFNQMNFLCELDRQMTDETAFAATFGQIDISEHFAVDFEGSGTLF